MKELLKLEKNKNSSLGELSEAIEILKEIQIIRK